jgi:hypothetical protein
MGSPISSLLADVFMSGLEEEIFTSNQIYTQHIQYWYRYVDDILCLWTGSTEEIYEFLNFINNFYPSIKFTLKVGGPSINFLDLKISLHNHKHNFEVYRKPTSTDLILDGTSYHLTAQKHAAIMSMIHRLITIELRSPCFAYLNQQMHLSLQKGHLYPDVVDKWQYALYVK